MVDLALEHLHVLRPLPLANAFPYRVRFERLHVVPLKPRHHASVHQHQHYEVMLIERGTYHQRINHVPLSIQAPGFCVIKPGDLHEDCCDEPVQFLSLAFQVHPGPSRDRSANLLSDQVPAEMQCCRGDTSLFFTLIKRIIEQGRIDDPFSPYVQDALALEFCWEWLRLLPRSAINPDLLPLFASHSFSSELLSLFEHHLSDRLSLPQMAEALGISQRTLTSRCRSAFATSPNKLFLRQQMDRARMMLVSSTLSITAIAEHFGYANPYHFSAVYKRVHGRSPLNHR